jgi:hypothetical protein
LKALVIASLVAALLVTPVAAQSNPFKSFERAVERVAAEGNKAVRRLDGGLARVEARHNNCEKSADGSGAAYLDCFVVRPVANSRPVVAVRSWSDAAWRRLTAL